MKAFNHIRVPESVRKSELQVKKNKPRSFVGPINTINRVLHMLSPKQIAADLDVSESIVSQWKKNEKPIPADRMFEIVKAGKAFCREVGEFESEIDMMVYLQFGKNPRGRE